MNECSPSPGEGAADEATGPAGLETNDEVLRQEHIGVGVITQAASGVPRTWSANVPGLLSLTRDELAGSAAIPDSWRAVFEDGTELAATSFAELASAWPDRAAPCARAGFRRSAEDELRWLHIHAHSAAGARPGPSERIWTLVDLSSRRPAAFGSGSAERPETQRLILAAIHAAANGIVITDTEGRVVWVNRAYTRLTGYGPDEAVGQPIQVLKSGRHGPELYDALWSTIRSGRVWQGELVNRRKNGELYDEAMTITPLHDAAGAITHYVAVKEDITEKLRMQAQLLHSQRLESIGRLAGGIAHDFNNLLGAVLGYAELATRQVPPESQLHRDLEEIVAAGKRGASLSRQLLAFAGAQPVAPSNVDVTAVVRELARMLQRVLGDDIRLNLSLTDEALTVLIDPAQLEQVLVNLAVNARDAMPDGGTLSIATSLVVLGRGLSGRSSGTQFVVLRVADSGLGMTSDVRKRAFEPFFTTKEAGRGTGLGLATCYGIITRAGGIIELESEPGHGAIFTVYLPLSMGRPAEVPGHAPAFSAPPREGAAVLLVEDHHDLRRLLTRVLEDAGYEVVATGDPERALDLARSLDFQVIVSDVSLPKMNGVLLARQLRELLGPLPVVLMSGFADESLIAEALQEAGVTFLPKPTSPDTLVSAVGEALLAGR